MDQEIAVFSGDSLGLVHPRPGRLPWIGNVTSKVILVGIATPEGKIVTASFDLKKLR